MTSIWPDRWEDRSGGPELMGTARESMLFMRWKEPIMRSYREAFDGVVARFPDAHVSTAGYETDTMFIVPPPATPTRKEARSTSCPRTGRRS